MIKFSDHCENAFHLGKLPFDLPAEMNLPFDAFFEICYTVFAYFAATVSNLAATISLKTCTACFYSCGSSITLCLGLLPV